MSVDLTGIPILRSTPQIVSQRGELRPPLGGPVQVIERLGSRWAWTFETTPMRMASAEYWSGMLMQARRDDAKLKVSQPDLMNGVPGAPIVSAATAAGRTVPVSGLTAGYHVRRGQWLSFQVGGVGYLDMNQNDVTANGAGVASLIIMNLLRLPLPSGAAIELATPKIEGLLTGLDQWAVERNRTVQFSFTIEEPA